MKVYITTEIEGLKQYVRRLKYGEKGRIAVSMLCSHSVKAKDFKNLELANTVLTKIGSSYKIESHE